MAVRKQRAPEVSPRGCHFKGTGVHSASAPRSEAGLEWRGTPGSQPMLLELLRPLSFFLSMLSLYPVMLSAFFVPGTRWEERLEMALLRIALAACVCFTSVLLYSWHTGTQDAEPLLSTLPVRLFFCAVGGMV